MNRMLKSALASVAVAAAAIVPVADAFAGDRYHRDRHYQGYSHDRGYYKSRRHGRPVVIHRHHSGDALAAGILGLAIGAVIAGAVNAPPPEPYQAVRPRPYRDYFPSAPSGYAAEPEVIYAQPYPGAAEPWTPEWYRYCAERFRSFDPGSGTYLGFDGKRHFCVAR